MPHIACDPPLDWSGILTYLGPRAIAGVESVTADGSYLRSVRIGAHTGCIAVRTVPDGSALEVTGSDLPLPALVSTVRRLFDLDTDPRLIAAHLARDATLAPFVMGRAPLRLVRSVDGFELAVRAVLGQAVTVRGASLLRTPPATSGRPHIPLRPATHHDYSRPRPPHRVTALTASGRPQP